MGLEHALGDSFLTTKIDLAINWCRKNSLWPMPMGISCCAIEMMAFAGPRFDVARFGSEVFRFSPRQSDVMIVAGTTTFKMAKVVRKIYDRCRTPNGLSQWERVHRQVECTAPTRWFRASISFCLWMSMLLAARHVPTISLMLCSSCRKKSKGERAREASPPTSANRSSINRRLSR